MYRLLGKKSQSATDKTNFFLSVFIGVHRWPKMFWLLPSSKHNLSKLVKPRGKNLSATDEHR
jgi:hypothetical protein